MDLPVTDEDVPEYQYDVLQGGDFIRLVNLDTGIEARGFPQGYEFRTFSLSETPKYYALSYCWGASERSDKIRCNGATIQVTPQLKAGFRELQEIPELRTWFWIDQISIDQSNLAERSEQVQLMTQIYSNAACTVVWLGPKLHGGLETSSDDEELFALAKLVFDIGQIHYALSYEPILTTPLHAGKSTMWNGRLPQSRGLNSLVNADPNDLGFPGITHHQWECLCAFFELAWFSRIWVIQEVFSSTGVPCLVYHGRLRNFLHILWAGAFVSQNITTFNTVSSLAKSSLSKRTKVTEHARLILQLAFARSQWRLDSLLWRTANYGATDHRDKYFALLSLTGEFQGNPTWQADSLAPDYEKELPIVARDFTRYIIENTKSLLVLSLINWREPPDPSKGASWAYVPSNDSKFLCFGEQYVLLGVPYQVKRKWNNAGMYLDVGIMPEERDDILLLRGIRFDHLVEVSPASSNAETLKLLEWMSFSYGILQRLGHLELESFFSMFWDTVCAGHDLDHRGAVPSPADTRGWLLSRSIEAHIPAFLKDFTIKEEEVDRHQMGDANNVQRWVDMYQPGGQFQYRQLAVTKKGYLTVGARAMQSTDIVCLLYGGELAYVLRSYGQHFQFLGECYIPQLSSGEWLQVPSMEKSEWFSLV
jgi:hypothetical protein